MLDAAVAVAHHQERVVLVWNIADQVGGRRHHSLEVGQHLRAVHGRRHVFDRDEMGHASYIEPQIFLVPDQDRRIVQHVEIGRREGVRPAWHRFEPGCNLLPIRRQLDRDRHRALEHCRQMHKDARRRKVGSIFAHVGVGRERGGSEDVVVQDNRRRVSSRDAPCVFRDFFPRQCVTRRSLRHGSSKHCERSLRFRRIQATRPAF